MNETISDVAVRPYEFAGLFGTVVTYCDDATGQRMSARFPAVVGVEEAGALIRHRRRDLRRRAVS